MTHLRIKYIQLNLEHSFVGIHTLWHKLPKSYNVAAKNCWINSRVNDINKWLKMLKFLWNELFVLAISKFSVALESDYEPASPTRSSVDVFSV